MALPVPAGPIGPAAKLGPLRALPDQVYVFVLRLQDGVAARDVLPAGTDTTAGTPLPLIGGLALPLKVSAALALADAPGVVQVWYLHPDLAPLQLRVMQALDWNVQNLPLPAVVNLSLGPPARFWSQDPDDPMHAATQAAARAGLIPVMAICNAGAGPGNRAGLVNPWCLPDWVICVGAHVAASGGIAAFSSRGDPARPETWPDVVAQGVDVIAPYPSHLAKSAARRARDERNAAFMAQVPPESRARYTLETGTSQAAAQVSGAAGQVLFFLRETIARSSGNGGPLFELTAPPDRANAALAAMPRLTGEAIPRPDGSTTFRYTADRPWKMVKQVLRDTAIALPAVPPEAGGAGLVDRALINAQFGAYGAADSKIAPSKVIE